MTRRSLKLTAAHRRQLLSEKEETGSAHQAGAEPTDGATRQLRRMDERGQPARPVIPGPRLVRRALRVL